MGGREEHEGFLLNREEAGGALKMDDALGDRMKMYEAAESERRFMPTPNRND